MEKAVKKWNTVFGELQHPTEQVEFPEVRRVYATTIPNPDYQDPRLLFLL